MRCQTALHVQFARRPHPTAKLAVTCLWPVKLSTPVAVGYADPSFDNDETNVVLEPCTLEDLRASHPLRENLTNKACETTYQFETLGRAGYGGARLSF